MTTILACIESKHFRNLNSPATDMLFGGAGNIAGTYRQSSDEIGRNRRNRERLEFASNVEDFNWNETGAGLSRWVHNARSAIQVSPAFLSFKHLWI